MKKATKAKSGLKPSKAIYDPELSKKYSKGAKIKECFDNCLKLMLYHDDFANAHYCEGMAGDVPVKVHHGWIELDGKIIDPTRIKAKHDWDGYDIAVRLTRVQLAEKYGAGVWPIWDYVEAMISNMPKKAADKIRKFQREQEAAILESLKKK